MPLGSPCKPLDAMPKWVAGALEAFDERSLDEVNAILVADSRVSRILDQTLKNELALGVASSRDRLLHRLVPTHDSLPHDAVLLEVPGSLEYRALVTRTVSTACRVASRSAATDDLDEYVNELVSAVGEAFNNIVIHGYTDERQGPICVIVEHEEGGIGIELRDFGVSFDPNAVELPDALEPSESGMGLFILRSFVDRVEYVAGEPNSLALYKRFPWHPASSLGT